jgi:FK506-binding protein 3
LSCANIIFNRYKPLAKKDSLSEAYNSLFTRKAFRSADEPSEEEIMAAKNTAPTETKVEAAVETGPPKFTKTVLKKGDKIGFPRKGSNGKISFFFFSFPLLLIWTQ